MCLCVAVALNVREINACCSAQLYKSEFNLIMSSVENFLLVKIHPVRVFALPSSEWKRCSTVGEGNMPAVSKNGRVKRPSGKFPGRGGMSDTRCSAQLYKSEYN